MDVKIVCKRCGNKLQRDDLFCPYCGHKVEMGIAQPENAVFCPECGTKNRANESFCLACGARLIINQTEQDAEAEEVAGENPVDTQDGVRKKDDADECIDTSSTSFGDPHLQNKFKNKVLLDKDAGIKQDISMPEPGKQSTEQADSPAVDAYDEWLDANSVDLYDEHRELTEDNSNPLHRLFSIKWIFAICICAFIAMIFWPSFSGHFPKDDAKHEIGLQDNGQNESERSFTSATKVVSTAPTMKSEIIPIPTLTPVITYAPTAIPVGPVGIDITPTESRNGVKTVSYEDNFRLSWHSSNASYYDVSLQGAAGNAIISDIGTTKTYMDVAPSNLSTGSYVLFVTAYNSSGNAGSTEKLWFDVASKNTYTELSDYLGMSLYSFVRMIDGMKDIGASDGVEYSNGAVTVHSPFDLDCITYIGLDHTSNYSICGVYIGQKMEAATDVLTDDGWRIVDGRENGKDYMDSVGNAVFIWSDDGNAVSSISIYLSDDALEDMYPSYFDIDDDWGTYTQDVEVVYTTGDVNIRKGPGKGYDSAGVIKAHTIVTYLGNSSVDDRGVVWYNILYNGINGWVSSKYTELRVTGQ